jgi:hypothetical protein
MEIERVNTQSLNCGKIYQVDEARTEKYHEKCREANEKKEAKKQLNDSKVIDGIKSAFSKVIEKEVEEKTKKSRKSKIE